MLVSLIYSAETLSLTKTRMHDGPPHYSLTTVNVQKTLKLFAKKEVYCKIVTIL